MYHHKRTLMLLMVFGSKNYENSPHLECGNPKLLDNVQGINQVRHI